LFNSLTGYSVIDHYRKLLVSPGGIRQGLTERIEREIEHAQAGRGGHIIWKINSLTDFMVVEELYKASTAGVKIDLVIRGSCSVVPGIKGQSENIRVTSIVGRFLEYERIYYFRNGGGDTAEVWLGSADVMQRNLDRRVETLFSIEDPNLKDYLINGLLAAYLKDNQKARLLLSDGSYKRIEPGPNEPLFDSQSWFLRRSQEYDPYVPLEESPVHAIRIED